MSVEYWISAKCPECGLDERHTPDCRFAGLDALYNELLMAVKNVYPGETRHEAALRLIREGQDDTYEFNYEGGKLKENRP